MLISFLAGRRYSEAVRKCKAFDDYVARERGREGGKENGSSAEPPKA
jgi:hypothetical protein